MRILMLAPPHEAIGPIPRIADELAQSLRAHGHEVTLARWGSASAGQSLLTRGVRTVNDIRVVARSLGSGSIDALYVHTGHDWPTVLRDLPLLLSVRHQVGVVALQLHGSQPHRLQAPGHRLFAWASRALMAMASVVFVLSNQERDAWEDLDVKSSFVTVVNPYVGPPARPQCADPEERVLRVLFVGRLLFEKGIVDTVDAVAHVRDDRSVTLEILGDGPARLGVESMVRDAELQGAVTLRGHVHHREVIDAMSRSDVLVLPSSWTEGFPTVLAEAMAMGLALVTTRIRGAADLLEDGVNAIFVPERSSDAIADALRRLADSPAMLARMAEANRERVLDFLPEKVVGTYEGALDAALHRENGRSPRCAK